MRTRLVSHIQAAACTSEIRQRAPGDEFEHSLVPKKTAPVAGPFYLSNTTVSHTQTSTGLPLITNNSIQIIYFPNMTS